MSRPIILRSLVVVGVASLALAGCSSDDNSGDSTSSPTAESTAAQGDGTLKIGTLLPQTGSLAFLGPPEFAGVDLAAKEINEAGGVNGADVETIVVTPVTPRRTSPPRPSTVSCRRTLTPSSVRPPAPCR